MSEQAVESNDTLQSLVDAAEPTLAEGEYFLSDNIKGSGDIPEWYKADKYKSVSEQARAYTELEKKFGGFTGAPKDGYELVQGVEDGDELWAELVEFGNETNMSQDALHKAWDLLTANETAYEQVSMEDELAKLGDNAGERVKNAEQYMKNLLDPETYEEAREYVTTADSIALIEILRNASAPQALPIDGVVQPGDVTWEEIEAEMFRKNEHGQLLRSVDVNHEKKIRRMMEEYGGDRQYIQTVG